MTQINYSQIDIEIVKIKTLCRDLIIYHTITTILSLT